MRDVCVCVCVRVCTCVYVCVCPMRHAAPPRGLTTAQEMHIEMYHPTCRECGLCFDDTKALRQHMYARVRGKLLFTYVRLRTRAHI